VRRKELIFRGPTYYSAGDEKAFFDWLYSIPAVEKVGGHSWDVSVILKRQPSKSDLRELIALLFRYRVEMKSLAALKTKRNAAWFAENKEAFWYAHVFGQSKAKKSN